MYTTVTVVMGVFDVISLLAKYQICNAVNKMQAVNGMRQAQHARLLPPATDLLC
jgi:hypothetical protein